MFKQVKSAVFWYYLFKFRRRITFVVLLWVIALFSNAIYGDVVEYLKLKDKLSFLEIVLISKWTIIIFSIVFSVYLLLTIFQKEEEPNTQKKTKKVESEYVEEKKEEEKFTEREKKFLYKKKLRTKADLLVE